MTKTLVVNFYGGPGTGKSTMTAHVFALLKWAGYNCEMAREYAKDKVWEKSINVLDDQIHVFGEQYHRLHILQNEVDIILTDSPLIMGLIYAINTDVPYTSLKHLNLDAYDSMNNLDIVLKRTKDFEPKGRLQNLNESLKIDNDIIDLLEDNLIQYHNFDATQESVNDIVDLIIKEMENVYNNSN